jgi:pyruvate-formate lyase-activating enzyme
VAEACDEVLFDFKIMDPERARSLLRMNQPRVLDNFRQLAARKINLIPRVPLIPGYTLNTDNFRQILAFLAFRAKRNAPVAVSSIWRAQIPSAGQTLDAGQRESA